MRQCELFNSFSLDKKLNGKGNSIDFFKEEARREKSFVPRLIFNQSLFVIGHYAKMRFETRNSFSDFERLSRSL